MKTFICVWDIALIYSLFLWIGNKLMPWATVSTRLLIFRDTFIWIFSWWKQNNFKLKLNEWFYGKFYQSSWSLKLEMIADSSNCQFSEATVQVFEDMVNWIIGLSWQSLSLHIMFQDMVNRRISMEMMLGSAKTKKAKQFVFLSPQSMR